MFTMNNRAMNNEQLLNKHYDLPIVELFQSSYEVGMNTPRFRRGH